MIKNEAGKYDAIDLLKFIGSILIFALHLNLFSGSPINTGIQLLARWCVPFFFITSAFFLFGKAENGKIPPSRLTAYVKRVLLLYLSWFVINIPAVIYTRIISAGAFSLRTYLYFIKNILLSSAYKGSWYLLSSAFSAVLIYLLSKKLSNRMILLCTLPLYLICAASSVYGKLLPGTVFSVLRFLYFPLNIFGGCFYFAIGKYLADNRRLISCIKKHAAVLLTIFSFAAFCAEVVFAKAMGWSYSTDASLCVALVGFSFVILGLKTSIKIKNSLALRKMSTIIYCAQGNILLLGRALKKTGLVSNDLLYFLIMSLVMAATVTVVLLLQKKVKLKALRYLT